MAIHLKEKVAEKVAESWTQKSLISGKSTTEYDFEDVKDVVITNTVPVELSDYVRSGTSRYGTPTEVQDEEQKLTMTQDKAFSATIDKGNKKEQNSQLKNAGRWLNRQLSMKVVPTSDKYTLTKWTQNAGAFSSVSAKPTKTNIVEELFKANEHFIDKSIPFENSYCYMASDIYTALRLSDEFMGVEKMAGEILEKGVTGECANFKIVPVPKSYLPADTYFVIAKKEAVINPHKIHDTKIHEDVPGISGNLIEGRFLYDAFVIGLLSDAVYVCAKSSSIVATPTNSGRVLSCTTSGAKVYYTTDGSDPRYSKSAEVASSSAIAGTAEIKACAKKDGMIQSGVLVVAATV